MQKSALRFRTYPLQATGRSLLGLALVGVFSLAAQAQTITGTLELGRREPRPLFFDYSSIDEGLVTISQAGASGRLAKQVGLYKYDAALQREWSLNLLEQNDDLRITQLRVLGQHILVFAEEDLSRSNQTRLSLYKFGIDGKTDGRKRDLYQARRERRSQSLMKYETSLDNRRLLMYGRQTQAASSSSLATIQAEENDTLDLPPGALAYAYTVFDAKTDSVYQGTVPMNVIGHSGRVVRARIGLTGYVYFLVRFEFNVQRGDPPPIYQVFRVNYFTRALEALSLNVKDQYITDLTFKVDINDNLILAGIYSISRSDKAAGIIYARIPADGSSPIVTGDRFDEQLLSRFASRSRVERGKAELTDFFLDDMVLRADSGVILLAEQYYVTTTTFRDVYGFWDSRRIFHYDEVLVVSVSPQGKIEWNTIIAKQQAAERPDQLSYSLFVGPEELYFFYKGKPKGLPEAVMVSSVDYTGKTSGPRSFYPTFRYDDIFYRRASQQISNTDGFLAHFQNASRTFTLTRIAF